MLGIIVILGFSWLLLHYLEKKNLLVLGFTPIKKRFWEFLVGFIFIVLLKLLFVFIETQILSIEWELNQPIDYSSIFSSFWYHIKSALTEDLIFRGALLYILINRIGVQKAVLISAALFGIYHWFSYGMIGGPIVPLIYVFITTGFTGYVWAYTFHRTNSIMMPLGFHLAINFISSLFYESSPYGQLIFRETSSIELSDLNNLYFSLFKGIVPSILTLIFVNLFVKDVNSKKNNDYSSIGSSQTYN